MYRVLAKDGHSNHIGEESWNKKISPMEQFRQAVNVTESIEDQSINWIYDDIVLFCGVVKWSQRYLYCEIDEMKYETEDVRHVD